MPPDLPPLPPGYVTTREGLHALAEHVLSPLRYRAEGRIGLQAIDGGFGPASARTVGGSWSWAISSTTATGRTASPRSATPHGSSAGPSARRPRCTSRSPTPTRTEPSASSPPPPQVVCGWFTFGAGVLAEAASAAAPDDDPSEAQLWPEHFDLALSIGPDGARANVGASPGDTDHDAPYLYVGPWEPRPGGLWNEPWGASLGYQAIRQGGDPLEFVQARCGPSSA